MLVVEAALFARYGGRRLFRGRDGKRSPLQPRAGGAASGHLTGSSGVRGHEWSVGDRLAKYLKNPNVCL
jgi:hypothetical protein